MEVNYCPNCGEDIAGLNYCPSCGNPAGSVEPREGSSEKGSSFPWTVLIVFLLIGLSIAFFIYRITRTAREAGKLEGCHENLITIAKALKAYSVDHQGSYPTSLQALKPDYLRDIPTCHKAGKDTYSESYRSFSPAVMGVTDETARYTFYCSGDHHVDFKGGGENFPQYTSEKGLILKLEKK